MTSNNLERIKQVGSILNSDTAIKIILAIGRGKLSVGDIVRSANAGSQTQVSNKLKLLREQGTLYAEREGTTIFYSVKDKSLMNILEQISNTELTKKPLDVF